jgi:type II secretory pathway pseudopilin PulG
MKDMKKKNSMCLIEMVLVVAIICILATVLLYNFVDILKVLGIQLLGA